MASAAGGLSLSKVLHPVLALPSVHQKFRVIRSFHCPYVFCGLADAAIENPVCIRQSQVECVDVHLLILLLFRYSTIHVVKSGLPHFVVLINLVLDSSC